MAAPSGESCFFTLLAISVASCAGSTREECDFIDIDQPVSAELYASTRADFWIAELPQEIRNRPLLRITSNDRSNGLWFWVVRDGIADRVCSTGPSDDGCSSFVPVYANSAGSFFLNSDTHGDYKLELALMDASDQASLQRAPVCARVVQVHVNAQ